MAGIIVFISGSGTNLQALIDAPDIRQALTLVVSNRKTAYGLTRAQQAAIPTLYFPLKPYNEAGRSRADYDADLAQQILPHAPDLIVLAGWMHVLSPAFLQHFPDKVVNLHPALPGAFAGTQAIQRAYEAHQRGEITETGCMVHYVVPEVDAGPVIGQRVVPIYPEDTLAQLEERMHQVEHALLVEAVRKIQRQKM